MDYKLRWNNRSYQPDIAKLKVCIAIYCLSLKYIRNNVKQNTENTNPKLVGIAQNCPLMEMYYSLQHEKLNIFFSYIKYELTVKQKIFSKCMNSKV